MDPVTAAASQLGTAADTAASSGRQEATLYSAQGEIKTSMATAAQEASDAAKFVTMQEGNAALALQETQRRIGRLYGSDITDTRTDLVTPLAEQQRDLNVIADQRHDEYARRRETNFFDDPMAWISNNVFGGTEQARVKYNDVAVKVNDLGSRIEQIYQQTHEGSLAAKDIEQKLTADAVVAKATLAGAQWLQLAGQAKYDSIGSDIGAIKALQEGNVQAANLRARQWEILKQDQAFQLQQKQYAISFAEHAEKVEERNTNAQILRLGYGNWGYAIPSDANINHLLVLMKTQEGQKTLGPIVASGVNILSTMRPDGTHDNSLGATAADAVFAAARIHPVLSDSDPRKKPLERAIAIAMELPEVKRGFKTEQLPEITKKINDAIKEDSESNLTNSENPGGIYYDKGFAATIKANPTLANSNFYKMVIAPKIDNKIDTATAKQLLSDGVKLVADGKLRLEELTTGMSTYYQTVGALNNTGAPKAGFLLQESYRADSGVGGKIDFMKAERINNAALALRNQQVGSEGVHDAFVNATVKLRTQNPRPTGPTPQSITSEAP